MANKAHSDNLSLQNSYKSIIDLNYLKLYENSLQSSSNTSSLSLLDQVWSTNSKLFNGDAGEPILDTTHHILQKTKEESNIPHRIGAVQGDSENTNTSHMKHWKTRLSQYDTVAYLEESLPTCASCTDQEMIGLKQFQNNQCKCDLGIPQTPNQRYNTGVDNKKLKSMFLGAEASCHSDKYLNENRPLQKPTFGQHNSMSRNSTLVPNKSNLEEIDWDKVEEDEKAHKSNVAKITFKTARDQLLASNPAARRTLGTSRKAQAKFISPMIGANVDKLETTEPEVTDDKLKHIDAKMIELIESEIIDRGTPIGWEDIAGLQLAKSVIQEAVVWPLLRPDMFTGLRRPPKGILLFGPPGTGKTLIGKCVAAQCKATFFSISASSLTSKWIGDGEKMVRALFAVARTHQPAVIFIDEIDSLLTARSESEHEATRRIKTEFLVQFDGAATGEEDRLLIVGATNRPQELDEAARRRLVKRLYIPLPDQQARGQMVSNLLQAEQHSLSAADMCEVARRTEGYSGADMKSLCSEAAMGPIRALPLSQIATIQTSSVRPVCLQDFINALQRIKPSVSQDDLGQYVKWNNTYGQGF